MTKVGPEGCICGGDHLAIPEPWDSRVCEEDQYCYHDPTISTTSIKSHLCVEPCQEMPTYNSKACYCNHEVCNDPTKQNFCYQNSSSCQRFERCPYTKNILYNHNEGYKQAEWSTQRSVRIPD